ncbi:MAG: tripartite tricarboxylate transporter TctB family protein [Rubrivivax sp.]|nr:tripartite tricarboxylate transporter TctB family protein [Rubrivivax sp.]
MTEQNEEIATRWPELIVAGLLAAIAMLVITDSLRVGAGWADDGPRAGYFPFYIGLALLGSSAWILIGQLRRWAVRTSFATRTEGGRVLSVLWPMVLYVVLIKVLGIYVASAGLITWFMTRHGQHSVVMRAAVALGVPLVVFAVFERWFLVPLPKGPLEALVGL